MTSKTKTEHLVPLASQAVAILRELHSLTGQGRHVFPGRDPHKAMSEAAVNAALERMGYDTKREVTGHGFRAMARTMLHENFGFPAEVIEHQLAHKVPDALGNAYNRTKFIEQGHDATLGRLSGLAESQGASDTDQARGGEVSQPKY